MKKLLSIVMVLLLSGVGFKVNAQIGAKPGVKAGAVIPKKLTEQQKIDHLIQYIGNLQGATFIRNGDEYPAKDAAEHMQMKRRKAGDRVKTARDFIEGIASESYLSGKPYHIRMKDGKTYLSRDVLMKELARIEKAS